MQLVLLKVRLIISLWQEDKAKVYNVKAIPNEACVPKHKLLAMDMRFNTTKRHHNVRTESAYMEAQKGKDM